MSPKHGIGIYSILLSLVIAFAIPSPSYANFPYAIELEWEPVEDARAYEVQFTPIVDEERQKPISFRTKKPILNEKVQPGQYFMRIRSYDRRGVPGPWSGEQRLEVLLVAPRPIAPKSKAKLKTRELEKAEVQFSWEAVAGAKEYLVEIKGDGKEVAKEKTSDTSRKIEVEVGKAYAWSVTAINTEDKLGDPSDWVRFSVYGARLATPDVAKPLSKIVTKLNWKKAEKAEKYSYELFRHLKGKKWKKVEKKTVTGTEIPFNTANPSGQYLVRVKAHAKGHPSSKRASLKFETQGGFRNPAAVKNAQLKESLRKPSSFYGIASYYISQAQYVGINREFSGQQAAFNNINGTGRLGLGYQAKKSKWGGIFQADLGGILVEDENLIVASLEGHATWKSYFWGRNLAILSGGLYAKELPEVLGSDLNGFDSIRKFMTFGGHAGFRLWRPISARLGLQLKGRLYIPVGGSSPNGESLNMKPSFEVGFAGSLRLSPRMTGFAGYVYRIDQISYNAIPFSDSGEGFAVSGDINEVELSGHYLNLSLEYSF